MVSPPTVMGAEKATSSAVAQTCTPTSMDDAITFATLNHSGREIPPEVLTVWGLETGQRRHLPIPAGVDPYIDFMPSTGEHIVSAL